MANKYNGEVPFPEMGEGVVLRYTWDDLAKLEAEIGADAYNQLVPRLTAGFVSCVRPCITHGAKKGGAAVPYSREVEKHPVEDVVGKINRALIIAHKGSEFLEKLEERLDQEDFAEGEKTRPWLGSEVTSSPRGEQRSEPESEMKSSGD